ncbi:MAG: hypothetical protein ACFFE4_05320, partial [Candidatus Thorarchaeota archaeon]
DTDGDELLDYEEIHTYGTDPTDPDTDGDGLIEWYEVFIYGTDPLNSDSDFDGLTDGDEVFTYSSDPTNSDTDGDGLTDGDEVHIYNTNPAKEDTDSDNLSDYEEVFEASDGYITNPRSWDTDGDELLDYEEIHTYGTDPTDPDTDGDGLWDWMEVIYYGTDPLNSDSDLDGYNDCYEIIRGYDPLDPLDPWVDSDDDGLHDYAEVNDYGTDPLDSDSDDDGISDGDEVNIYGTDPLANVDTYTSDGFDVQITDQNYGISLTFESVTGTGVTTIELSETGPDPPIGFQLGDTYFSISTTAEYSGNIYLEIPYDEGVIGDENYLTLLHFNEVLGEWEDITIFVDTVNNIIHGEFESFSYFALFVDIAPPSITIETPGEDQALQDGITFTGKAEDLSGIIWVNITVREDNGESGIFIHDDFENIPAIYNEITNEWKLFFDTTILPDGFYLLVVEAADRFQHIGSKITSFSIRNWAVLEFLPATEDNNPGRTMPVKFSVRVHESVDINTPFIRNEEINILIYTIDDPNTILQNATFGINSIDYRIDSLNELYITNFKTLKHPQTYLVEIWRKGMLIGSFTFETIDRKDNIQDSGESTGIFQIYLLEFVEKFKVIYLPCFFLVGISVAFGFIINTLKKRKFKIKVL